MSITRDTVDPSHCVVEAAEVLQSAWKPPRLRYAVEDLVWQFARPGWGKPRGSIVRNDAGLAVGFSALMPRTVKVDGAIRDVWLASFFSVRSGASPGAALLLNRAGGRELREWGRPVVVFAQPGSIGEVALRGWDAAGLYRKSLGISRVHGGIATGNEDLPMFREATEVDFPAICALTAQRKDAAIIRDTVDLMSIKHDQADPRGRCWAIAEDPDGKPRASACTYLSESIGQDGPVRTATLTAVTLSPEAGGSELASLIRFASRKWAAKSSSPIVTLPNPSGIDPAHLRAARLRAMPAAWAAFVFAPDADDPILLSQATDLEVI